MRPSCFSFQGCSNTWRGTRQRAAETDDIMRIDDIMRGNDPSATHRHRFVAVEG
jgi:hypothetical protein